MQAVLEDGTVWLNEVEIAAGFTERLKGLLGRSRMAENHGMLIAPCSSIHTFFMRFPIDVVFLACDGGGEIEHAGRIVRGVSSRMRVISLRSGLEPWRVAVPLLPTVSAVIETAAGAVDGLLGETVILR